MRNPSSSSSSRAGTSSSPRGGSGTKTPCCSKLGLKRGPWTPDEDQLLSNYINKEGEGRWRTLPKRAGLLRCGKSCRLRWMNYLRPSVKRGQIAPDEEDLILRLHRLLGNRWSLIAGRIPGRTDNEIKNYWNTHLSKKLISQGIDPRTHKPLNPNNPNPSPPTTYHGRPASNSSKPTPLPPPPIPNTPITPENPPTHQGLPLNDQNGYFHPTINDHHLDPYQAGIAATDSDGSAKGFRSNSVLNNEEEDDDDDINYCSDDVFSSFLNSLINEDAFSAQQPPNGINGWESALMSSTFTQNDPNMADDHDD